MNVMRFGMIAAFALAAGFARADFELVGEKGEAKIVIPEKADDSTSWAAEMLQKYVKKITGRHLTITSDVSCLSSSGGAAGVRALPSRVVIGTLESLGEAVPKDIAQKLKAAKQYEASFTRVTDDTLWIVGKEVPGEHYAVNHFLDTRCGVTWFTVETPEDPGELVPQRKTLVFKTGDLFREPAFEERRLSMVGAVWYPIPTNAMEICFRDGFQAMIAPGYPLPNNPHFWKNGHNARYVRAHVSPHKRGVGGGHGMFGSTTPGWVKPTKENGNFSGYFKDHPEYFPLVNGKRVDNGLHCFSNPDVQRREAEKAIENFKVTDGDGFYLFGMADQTFGWCECDECRKLDPPGIDYKKGTPDVSTRFTKVINNIAKMIYEKLPNAELHRWAYHTYRNRPVGVEDDPRFKLQYCAHGRCYGHRLDDPKCSRNQPFYKELKAWLDAPNAGGMLYDYLLQNSDDFYACAEQREAEDIQLYLKMGIVGWKNEMCYSGSQFVNCDAVRLARNNDYQLTNWRYFYVVGRLLWDPTQDVEKTLQEVDAKFYGKAAAPMVEYQKIRRKLWNAAPTCFGYPWGNPRSSQLLNDLAAKDRLLKLLDEAEAIVGVKSSSSRKESDIHSPTPTPDSNSILRHRIADDRRWLDEYWIKPNDRLRARMGSEFKAPITLSPVTVDGKGDEPAWANAFYTDAFKGNIYGEDHPDIPAALKTTVGILSDKENFYFLVTAKEPHPEKMQLADGQKREAWWGDHMEFFLFPPNVENKYYQVAVNSAGVVFTAAQPGTKSFKIDVETKSTVKDGLVTMEIKVPVKGMWDLRPGDSWRLHICRSRGFDDEFSKKDSWTIDGTGFHQPSEYRPIEIGSAFLINGSFDDVKDGKLLGWDAKVEPEGRWILDRGLQQVKREGVNGKALRIVKSMIRQSLGGPFAMSDKPRKMKFSLKAKGPGELHVTFWRFTEIPQHRRVDPHGVGGTFVLYEDEWQTCEGKYTVQPNEVVYFVIDTAGTTVEIDDLVVLYEE